MEQSAAGMLRLQDWLLGAALSLCRGWELARIMHAMHWTFAHGWHQRSMKGRCGMVSSTCR